MSLENSIKNLVSSKVFLEGKTFCDEDKVSELSSQSFWKGEYAVTAKVLNNKPRIKANGDKIVGYGCTCSTFRGKEGICNHVVALAIKYSRQPVAETQSIPDVVYTSKEGRDLINEYISKYIDKDDNEISPASLVVNLDNCMVNQTASNSISVDKSVLYIKLSLKIKDKVFVLADLGKFFNSIKNKEVSEYGRNTVFMHSLDAFSKSDRDLLLLLMSVYTEQNIVRKNNKERILSNQVILCGRDIDAFFDIYSNKEGSVNLNYNGIRATEDKIVKVLNDNPRLLLDVRAVGNNGYYVTLDNRFDLIKTVDHIYVVKDSILYICDDEYMKACENFIAGMLKGMTVGNSFRMDVSKKDMSSYYNLVLKTIDDHFNIEYNGLDLASLEIGTLNINFKVLGRDDEIELKVLATYGGNPIDLIKGTGSYLVTNRDYIKENQIKQLIKKYFRIEDNGTIHTTDMASIYRLMNGGFKQFESFGDIELDDNIKAFKVYKPLAINANVKLKDNLINLELNDLDYTKEELHTIINAYHEKATHVKLNGKGILDIKDAGFDFIATLYDDIGLNIDDITNNNIFIPGYRMMYVDSMLKDSLGHYTKNEQASNLLREIKHIGETEYDIPESLKGILRGYQQIGFSWLKTIDKCGFGGILADDMGLGKTIQIISLILSEKKNGNTSFIVTPASLVYNWENEIKRFASELKVLCIVGSKSERMNLIKTIDDYDIVITSYDLLKRDVDSYKGIKFRYHVIDEAQYIKNPLTEAARTVKMIDSVTRYALTGTPIENRLSELWSIFDFIMPKALYTYQKFREHFELPIINGDEDKVVMLKKMIAPFILRRMKAEVLKELPEKLEYEVYTKLEGEQNKLYLANALKLKEELTMSNDSEFNANKVQVFAELTRLRQICCDPSLCYENYEDESAKLTMCIDLLKNGIEGGHKILLFSQFTSMLAIISEKLKEENINHYILTGATNKEERIRMTSEFNRDETPVFLISLKAGGTGLNLASADMVIHYDPWWNFAVETQATDRAHRIGQKNKVSVFKLIAKDTIEEYIVGMQKQKEKLATDILSLHNKGIAGITRSDLIKLL